MIIFVSLGVLAAGAQVESRNSGTDGHGENAGYGLPGALASSPGRAPAPAHGAHGAGFSGRLGPPQDGVAGFFGAPALAIGG